MASMVLGDSTLESLTPSVNAPLMSKLMLLIMFEKNYLKGLGFSWLFVVISNNHPTLV
jgi:hypothetical protein